ncbi:MAG: azurin [Chitinophagaceae bacterium]|nr:MAG: azurin [Chitinophagaceae bacterium]
MNIKHFLLPALLTCLSSTVFAEGCATTISGNDSMQFDKKTISVPKSCKKFTVTLTHTGKAGKNIMGHNWVLTKTEDAQPVATEGVGAGIDNGYVKAGDKRVIAASKMIGGGESTIVDVPVSQLKAGTGYTFFCSFPGHIALMKGSLTLE